jgi:hypothetical protein
MRKLVIGVAAAITLAAVAPANAQGLWLGVPGFGVGIGVGPTYAYDPYYDGYWGNRYWNPGYAYEPTVAYSDYALAPEFEYDAYAYGPDYGYTGYGPRVGAFAYQSTDSYRYAPRVRYSRNYAYSPEVRTARSYSYADTRNVRERGHRTAKVYSTNMQHRSVMRDRPAFSAETRRASSTRMGFEASRTQARGTAEDLRQSKSLETGKAKKGSRSNSGQSMKY